MPASFQSAELGYVRARSVSTGDEGSGLRLYGLERGDHIGRPRITRRIALRPNENEVVVHDRVTLDAKPLGQEFFLG